MKQVLKGGVVLVLMVASLSLSVGARGARNFEKTVQLIAGRADTVELRGEVSDVLVANPAIADVGTLRSNRLYIVGKTVGDTNVLAYDEAGNQLANISVHVRLDDRNMQETLREFFPDEKISARTVKDNIVLSGTVSTPAIANQVRDLATRFLVDKSLTLVDLMKVRGEQQVMLKVKVVEAQRSALKELGLRTNYRTGGRVDSTQTSIIPDAGGSPNGTGETTGPRFTTNDLGRTVQLPFGSAMMTVGRLTEVINALERHGIVNTLAEPNLTAISGETAGFLAGGEFPVPSGRDTSGNVTIDFKQFGVSLNFTPTILSKERIALHLSTEVSEQDASKSVTLANVVIPGLAVRRAETTVELGSGSTIMIAGLIKSSTINSMNGLPGVQDLPILGPLFKSKSFQRDESELLIMVSPFLVNSFEDPEGVAEKVAPPQLPGNPVFPPATAGDKMGMMTPPSPAPVPTVEKDNILAKEEKAAMPPASLPALSSRPVKEVHAENRVVSPLARSFAANMRKTYGNRVPDNIGTGAGFGYIVE